MSFLGLYCLLLCSRQIQEEKLKEESRTTQLKVVNRHIDQVGAMLYFSNTTTKAETSH